MPKQPEQGIAGQLSPVLKAAWEEQLRDIEQSTNKEMLAEMHYRATLWLSALVQGRVIATNAAKELRVTRDRVHQQTERRLDAEPS